MHGYGVVIVFHINSEFVCFDVMINDAQLHLWGTELHHYTNYEFSLFKCILSYPSGKIVAIVVCPCFGYIAFVTQFPYVQWYVWIILHCELARLLYDIVPFKWISGTVSEQVMLLENIGTSVLVSKNQVSFRLSKIKYTSTSSWQWAL